MIELLVDGLDDWVSLHDVVWHGRELADGFGGDIEAAVRAVVLDVIAGGLMYPGELGERKIDPWPGEVPELVERVVGQCRELEWNPQGDGCWFANTAEGDRVAAERVAQRRAAVASEANSADAAAGAPGDA